MACIPSQHANKLFPHLMVMSCDQESSLLPSGLMLTHHTGPLCPSSVRLQVLRPSHTLEEHKQGMAQCPSVHGQFLPTHHPKPTHPLSQPPHHITNPPFMHFFLKLPKAHLMVVSMDPDASVFPSGLMARLSTEPVWPCGPSMAPLHLPDSRSHALE